MRRPARLLDASKLPGGSGNRALRHYERTRGARMTDKSKGLNVSAGPEPQIPRWSAERRASRVMGCKAPRKRLRAYVTGPPTGAAAPERLSALCSLALARRNNAKLGGRTPRENGDG